MRRRARPSRRRRLGAVALVGVLLLAAGAALSTGLVVVELGGARTAGFTTRTEAAGTVEPDTAAPPADGAAGGASAAPSVELPALAPPAGDSAAPPVAHPAATPAELADLAARLAIPVAGVTADRLVDSFDDARGDRGADPHGERRHDAIDIPAPRGTPVVAATDGRVLELFDSAMGGLTVHALDASGRFVLLYGHLDRYAPGLRDGAPLRRGQTIGFVGTTGNAAPETPHLHFAILRSADPSRWWEGTPVNPYPLLRR